MYCDDFSRRTGCRGSRSLVVKNIRKTRRNGERQKKEPRKRLRATEPGRRGFRAFCSLPGAIEHERSSNWAPDAVLHASIREYAKGRGGVATGLLHGPASSIWETEGRG